MSEAEWVFVAASALVEFLGVKAKQAVTWWPFISSSRNVASSSQGVLVIVAPRNEFIPLLHIAIDVDGDLVTYNPESLKKGSFALLVPAFVAEQVKRHAEQILSEEASRQALIAINKARMAAERPVRAAVEMQRRKHAAAQMEVSRIGQQLQAQNRRKLLAPIENLIFRYRLAESDLLSPEDCPTWVYKILKRILSDESFSEAELLTLRKSSYKYLAAAVHWRAWEIGSDPWNVVHTCSLLRQVAEPRKAVKLLSQIDISGWNGSVSSAFFTTLGGAQRDAGTLDKAWDSAKAALLKRDDKPHPYLLLGALCYQLDRHAEGDGFFADAHARGATEKDINLTRKDAESRRRNERADDIEDDF